jgi:thiol:disulfide interchange protein
MFKVSSIFRHGGHINRVAAVSILVWMWLVTFSEHRVFAAPVKLYDVSADGSKQVEQALQMARTQHKRVLLQFGANWCVWCVRLHGLFQSDRRIAARLKDSYVVALIDVSEGHNAAVNERFGKPTRFGLPAIVVLDEKGKALVTLDTETVEEGSGHNATKVLAFLDEWAVKRP